MDIIILVLLVVSRTCNLGYIYMENCQHIKNTAELLLIVHGTIYSSRSASVVPESITTMGIQKYNTPQSQLTELKFAKDMEDKSRTSVLARVTQVSLEMFIF